MISKELLSEVLGSPVEKISFDKDNDCEVRHGLSFENKIDGVSYIYVYGNKESRFMSIHELAHKCKEWALTKGYFIDVGVHPTANVERRYFSTIKSFPESKFIKSSRTGESTLHDYERVFYDCQWILEND